MREMTFHDNILKIKFIIYHIKISCIEKAKLKLIVYKFVISIRY